MFESLLYGAPLGPLPVMHNVKIWFVSDLQDFFSNNARLTMQQADFGWATFACSDDSDVRTSLDLSSVCRIFFICAKQQRFM